MHRVFISFHAGNDQAYKDALVAYGMRHRIFLDYSVDTGAISDSLPDEVIREKIRDEYLRDSTVTILLVGTDTWGRKHVDWELYSSMINGKVNKKSGVLVVNLPSTGTTFFVAAHGDREKAAVYPECNSWMSVDIRAEYERRYPYMPPRIVDNLLAPAAKISVVPWERITGDPRILSFLIDLTFQDRLSCTYDLSRPMRRSNA